MQRILKLIMAVWLVGLLASCDENNSTPPVAPARPADNAAKISAEWQEKLKQERQLRQTAETRLRESEARVADWQVLTVLALASGVVALLVGAMLGSRARKDAKDEAGK